MNNINVTDLEQILLGFYLAPSSKTGCSSSSWTMHQVVGWGIWGLCTCWRIMLQFLENAFFFKKCPFCSSQCMHDLNEDDLNLLSTCLYSNVRLCLQCPPVVFVTLSSYVIFFILVWLISQVILQVLFFNCAVDSKLKFWAIDWPDLPCPFVSAFLKIKL